jgi:hypothetical protein
VRSRDIVDCIIYSLIDPVTDAVRYIGKSTYGIERAREHGRESQLRKYPSHKSNWIWSLHKSGLDYRIEILERCSDKNALCDLERQWIAKGRAAGWPLTNLTDGGDGTPGVIHNPQRAERIRQALKGRKRPPFSADWRAKIGAGNLGKKMPPKSAETLARMSASHKGAIASPEARAKMSAAHKGKKHVVSPEGRASINTAMALRRGIPLSVEHKEKLRQAIRRPMPPRTPEHNEKLAAARRGKKLPPRSPEHCAAISAGQRARRLRLQGHSESGTLQ